MKKIALLLLIIQITSSNISAQTGTIAWKKYLGTQFSDETQDILVANDGNILSVGQFIQSGAKVHLSKHSPAGDLLWDQKIGSDATDWRPTHIKSKANGELVISGGVGSFSTFIFTASDVGVPINSYITQDFVIYDFVVSNTGFMAIGEDDYPMLIKFDEQLGLVWTKEIQDNDISNVVSIDKSEDGNYYVLCETNSGQGISVLKVNESGNVLWKKSYMTDHGFDAVPKPVENNFASGNAAIVTHPNGGYVIGATHRPPVIATQNNFIIIRCNAQGTMLWNKSIGCEQDDYLGSISLKPNGNIIAVGKSDNISGNVSGNLVDKFQQAWAAEVAISNGNLLWDISLGNISGDVLTGASCPANNTCYFSGYGGLGPLGQSDGFVVKVAITGITPVVETFTTEPIVVFPNPTTNQITISLEPGFSGQARVYDLRGKLVLEANLESTTDETQLNVEGLPKGCYELLLFNQNGTTKTGKFVRS